MKVAAGRSICSLFSLNLESMKRTAVAQVDRPSRPRRIGVWRRKKNSLSTDVDKVVCNSAGSLLDSVGGTHASGDGSLTSWGGETWKVCGRGLRTGYVIRWAKWDSRPGLDR